MLALGNHHGHHGHHHGGGWGPWGPGWYSDYYPYVDLAPVYVPTQTPAACGWYQDVKTASDGSTYCQGPALWLVIAGGFVLLLLGQKKK